MQKTIEQLQAELAREKGYTTKLNRQIDRLREQLRNTISLAEHERLLSAAQREYESELSKIKNQQTKQHSERGAGRKPKATKEIVQRVLALREGGLSQQSIAQTVSDELGIADIHFTTVVSANTKVLCIIERAHMIPVRSSASYYFLGNGSWNIAQELCNVFKGMALI